MNGAAGAAESDLISRVDTDVVEWFKTRGKGHLTRMNAVLRAYVDAHYERRQLARLGGRPATAAPAPSMRGVERH